MAEEWTPERIEALTRLEALRQGVDPNLAVAVAKQESSLKPFNHGDNGKSRGVFHLQRAAAIDAGIDPEQRDDPITNIKGGVTYLKQRLTMSKGDVPQALSRYNRGTPDYRGIGDPDYVYHVMRHYPGHELGKAPTDQEAYRTRLNQTFGKGTAGPAEKPGLLRRMANLVSPSSAEAAEPPKPWYEPLPPKSATATEPTRQTEPQAGGSAASWYEPLPEKPPAEPTAPPVTTVPATQPPAASVPPAPAQRPQPPTARSTAEQDAAYRRSVGQEEPPASVPPQEPQSTVTPESRARAQMLQPYTVPELDPAAISKEWEEAGAASTDPAWWSGADPSSPRHQAWLKSSPMPSTREVAREVAATGVEGAYGVLGTMAGTAIGGPPGAVAGGIAGQSFGRRVTNQAGLRSQEPYIATGFGMNLYPSDVANVGMGLLTGGPALFKHGLSKTTAGKAIVQAEMSTKEAYQAWQIERQRLQAAQKTGQQAEVNIALKDHATAEANYKRLVEQRNATVAANKAEYDQAVKDFETNVTQQHEAKVATDLTAEQSQAAAIPEAKAMTKPYEAGEPAHKLYDDIRKQHSDKPVVPDEGRATLQELRANRPKTFAGTPSPFEGEVETIAQAFETSTGPLNVATVHDQLKKLGPLTRHSDGKIRGDAKQLAGVLMDVLETAPEAAGAIKAANQRWKREEALKDMNEWLKPKHGVIDVDRKGRDTINPGAFLGKFKKELEDSKLFRDSFSPEEVAEIQGNIKALAERTPRMPTRELTAPTPQSMQRMPGRPKLKETPEVPPIYPEFPEPGQRAGLAVKLKPPAEIPPEPTSTSMWYPEPLKKSEWIRKRPPAEGQWTREQWETYAEEKLGKSPKLSIRGTLGGAGGMAFALQRMGFSPAAADASLWGVAVAGLAGSGSAKAEWLLSRALLRDRYRPLLQEAMMDNQHINPYFYNAMLAALTPEDRKEYEREVRSTQQKARR